MKYRPRRPSAHTRSARAALTAGLVLCTVIATASCAAPNSVFTDFTEFNRDIGYLFSILIFFGTLVFVIVEVILIVALWRFRRRPGAAEPKQVHGNTTLEILWTLIPAAVLVFIAVPTVRTIFRTQARARPDALEVTVIGHQWWWEFRYPQFTAPGPGGRVDTLVTANELYLPMDRTVNFSLRSANVLHSFWIPQLGGKRDVVPNHTNILWFTPDSTQPAAFNGFCAEYCGASHANMRFRAFVVTPQDFESWARHQLAEATFNPGPPTPQPGGPALPPTPPPMPPASITPAPPGATAQFTSFPRDQIPAHVIPQAPLPPIPFSDAAVGDPTRGARLFAGGSGGCIGCHAIRGVPTAVGRIGPNLTHFGSRATLAAGLYPNETPYLARWIKNSRAMKPGVVMPALGRGEYDPVTKQRLTAGLDDQQIADLVAYLQSLQ